MKKIAACESHGQQWDEKGNIVTGKIDPDDTGMFQINTRYHLKKAKELGDDIYTTKGNIDYAKYLLDTYSTVPWNSSRGCWEP